MEMFYILIWVVFVQGHVFLSKVTDVGAGREE